jgi:hypothetical protein
MSAKFNWTMIFPLMVFACLLGFSVGIRGQSVEDIEIIKNTETIQGKSGVKQRNVYVYIDEKKFDREKIVRWMKDLSQKFRNPTILTITVFTNKEMLDMLIRFESNPPAIDFSNDEIGRNGAAEFYGKIYPKSQGYLRVIYHRFAEFEYIEYSPEKDSSRMLEQDLKLN